MKFTDEQLKVIFHNTEGRCMYCGGKLSFSNCERAGQRDTWTVDLADHNLGGILDGSNHHFPAHIDCKQKKGRGEFVADPADIVSVPRATEAPLPANVRRSAILSFAYVHGIPGHKGPGIAHLTNDDIQLEGRKNAILARIPLLDVSAVSAEVTDTYIPPVEVDKSVLGRGLVGGLLLGPAGAVVGGLSGVGKKTVSPGTTKHRWCLHVTYVQDGLLNVAVFKPLTFFGSPSESKTREVSDAILVQRQAAAARMKQTQKAEALPAPIASLGEGAVLDQLSKLAELKTSGVLSEEEFSTMKARILKAGQPSPE